MPDKTKTPTSVTQPNESTLVVQYSDGSTQAWRLMTAAELDFLDRHAITREEIRYLGRYRTLSLEGLAKLDDYLSYLVHKHHV